MPGEDCAASGYEVIAADDRCNMTDQQIRSHVLEIILARLDLDPERRAEALADFLTLSLPHMDEASVKAVAARVPVLPQSLYEKWIGMFADRLLETIPRDQLEELCNGTQNNNTTLGMVYLLFMESARMEEQTARDLAALGLQSQGAGADSQVADALSLYLKAQLGKKNGANQ